MLKSPLGCYRFFPAGLLLLIVLIATTGSAGSTLLEAIRADDLPRLEAMVAADPELPKRPIPFHGPPLHVAAAHFRPAIFRFLLEHGADVNARDDAGENALFKLVSLEIRRQDRFEIIREMFLLCGEHHVEINRPNRQGETPLYVLAGRQFGGSTLQFKLALMETLIAMGALPAGSGPKSQPLLLHVLKRISRSETSRINAVDTVKFLLEHGAEPDAADADGDTAMIRVIKAECLSVPEQAELIRALIEHGANPRRKNKAKESPARLVDRDDPLSEALKYRPAKPHR